MTYLSDSPSVGGYVNSTGIWTVGNLSATPGAEVATLTIVAQVKSSTSGLIITNDASVNAVDQGDQNAANDLASIDSLQPAIAEGAERAAS